MEHKLFFFNRTFDIYESLLSISNIQLCNSHGTSTVITQAILPLPIQNSLDFSRFLCWATFYQDVKFAWSYDLLKTKI